MDRGFDALRRRHARLKSDLWQIRRTANLAAAIPVFLQERVTVARAEEEIKRALDLSGENFLELARTRIYENPASPYLMLLKIAGCEYSDLCDQVRRRGLEKTLEDLAKEGVYLSSDEYKGKREVARGGKSFRVVPGEFTRLSTAQGIISQSSGTRSSPVRAVSTLDRFTETAFELAVFFSAHNLLDCSHAVYDGILPVSGGIRYLLIYAKLGVPIDRWFARKIPVNSRLEGWYHYLTTYMIVLTGKWYEPGFPKPEFIDIQDVERIVHWVLEKKQEGVACCIKTAASNANRIARVAGEKGISLQGTKFIVGGEPFTEAKQDMIERVGARAINRYSFSGGGNVGLGCPNALYADEIHVGQHGLTVIPHPQPLTGDGLIHPLLFSTVSSRSDFYLLNVENGDYATLENRGLRLRA